MSNKKELTIIMSCYNQALYIEKAVDSVLMQETNFNWELIITDDHSTKDNSIEIINKLQAENSQKIKILLSEHNGGYLENVLRAKNITKTKYFCLLDADDYWIDKHYLQKAFDFLESHKDFTIYSTNVKCLYEDNNEETYIKTHIKSTNFDINNFLNNNIIIPQTTGSFFRNIIFANGIPKQMLNSKNSISKYSFEGDFARYLMHLKYGKAHFENYNSGVYRILSNGIWNKRTKFEQNLLMAQFMYDFNKYFDYNYDKFFTQKMLEYYNQGLESITNKNEELNCSKEIYKIFENIYNYLRKIKNKPKKLNFKYSIILKLYNALKQKLIKKNII